MGTIRYARDTHNPAIPTFLGCGLLWCPSGGKKKRRYSGIAITIFQRLPETVTNADTSSVHPRSTNIEDPPRHVTRVMNV